MRQSRVVIWSNQCQMRPDCWCCFSWTWAERSHRRSLAQSLADQTASRQTCPTWMTLTTKRTDQTQDECENIEIQIFV